MCAIDVCDSGSFAPVTHFQIFISRQPLQSVCSHQLCRTVRVCRQTHTHTHTLTASRCMCVCICMTDAHRHKHAALSSHLIGRLISHLLSRGADRDSRHCGTSLPRHTHTHTTDTKLTDTTRTHTKDPPRSVDFHASAVQLHSSWLIDCHHGCRD